MPDHPRLQLSSQVQLSRTGDRCVLFNANTGSAIVLNPTGTILAGLLEKPQTHETMASQLADQFAGLSLEQAISDTSAFLTQLQEHKMLSSGDQ